MSRVGRLAGRGKSFRPAPVGNWMKRAADNGVADNPTMPPGPDAAHPGRDESRRSFASASGAHGMGLAAACDITVASTVPPHVRNQVRHYPVGDFALRAVRHRGARQATATSSRPNASTPPAPREINLVHEAVDPDQLDARSTRLPPRCCRAVRWRRRPRRA